MKPLSALVATSFLIGICSAADASGSASVDVGYSVASDNPSQQSDPSMSPFLFFSSSTWSDAPGGPGNYAQGYFTAALYIPSGFDPNGWGDVVSDGQSAMQADAYSEPAESFSTSGETNGDYMLSAYSTVTFKINGEISQSGGPGGGIVQFCFADTHCDAWSASGGSQRYSETFVYDNDTADWVDVDFSASVTALADSVPEPSSTALLAAGIGLLGLGSRRRRAR